LKENEEKNYMDDKKKKKQKKLHYMNLHVSTMPLKEEPHQLKKLIA
jgi:hypothetical protein